MARRVYFAFHYQDVSDFRANVVRNSKIIKNDIEYAPYHDASLWEEAQKKGEIAIKRLINDGLQNTSVTAVLIGTETYQRKWVRYEIIKSFERGNGLLGIYIHNIRDKYQQVVPKGQNPFDYLAFQVANNGTRVFIFEWNGHSWVRFYDLPEFVISYSLLVRTCRLPSNLYGMSKSFSEIYTTYDWVQNDGYNNFSSWVESASRQAER